jgi:hypothetical protein
MHMAFVPRRDRHAACRRTALSASQQQALQPTESRVSLQGCLAPSLQVYSSTYAMHVLDTIQGNRTPSSILAMPGSH